MTELLLRCFRRVLLTKPLEQEPASCIWILSESGFFPTELAARSCWIRPREGVKQWKCWAVTSFTQTANFAEVKIAARIVLHKGYCSKLCLWQQIYKQADLVGIGSLANSTLQRHKKKKKTGWIKLTIHKSFLIRAASLLPQFFY